MDYQVVGAVLGALFFISGGLATLYKFMGTIRKEREDENRKILDTAKEYVDNRVRSVEAELSHQKDLHEGKIAELSDKIDQLKDEMSKHHVQLMDFLIQSIDNKKK
tara:strand:+ start:4725 stop:5042 length:318 start_codon:yes stop_codon:yes gene_type:complete